MEQLLQCLHLLTRAAAVCSPPTRVLPPFQKTEDGGCAANPQVCDIEFAYSRNMTKYHNLYTIRGNSAMP